ncbi:hypothetical protein Raf01_06540 [Rugosimonospora africana]|uniref:Uncharacterized protein n=2 Tax=Rugosimonospora africana TaxID=556532 RepID=A0A8J3QLZ0_9ACTN|nr:hypothetical protein Raf01_06540 [Rugosimonospora africana]
MFGPGQSSRLGSALTQQLIFPGTGDSGDEVTEEVESSWCAVEVQNDSGDVLTAQRPVKHATLSRNLVRVWNGPALTRSPAQPAEDYFVRESGATQRARGFHTLLVSFLGWELPLVPRFTGGEVPLYPEVIFPFVYGDQRAWNSASARQVTHFQIREPSRRAVEFLLAFQGPAAQSERQRLEDTAKSLRAEWTAGRQSALAAASVTGARIFGIPDLPAGTRAGSKGGVSPTSLAEAGVEVLDGGEWRPLPEVLRGLIEPGGGRTAVLEEPARTVADVGIERLQTQLRRAEDELGDMLATASAVEQKLSINESQLAALDRRITALEEERQRNLDVKTLIRLGSDHPEDHLADNDCPTCHQSLASVEIDSLGPSLNVDETLGLLNAQLATMRGMREQMGAAVDQGRGAYAALQRAADSSRSHIRSIQDDLVAPEDYPSASDITQRVVSGVRSNELERLNSAVAAQLEQLQHIAIEMAETRTELNRLPTVVPDEDVRRRTELADLMREQLKSFGFSSYDSAKVDINEETLRPERPGFDLDTDVSASDVVRIKIAYLNAVRELSSRAGGPHPGLLMLDEPRQHELDEAHFRSAISRLASGSGRQVIITTAASTEALAGLLKGNAANVIDFGSARLMRREEPNDPLDLI